jgi:hypothetical protein
MARGDGKKGSIAIGDGLIKECAQKRVQMHEMHVIFNYYLFFIFLLIFFPKVVLNIECIVHIVHTVISYPNFN